VLYYREYYQHRVFFRYFEVSFGAPTVKERYAFFSYIGSDDHQYPNGGRAGARGEIRSHEKGFQRNRFFKK
jgi:hypothetical protein